MQKLTRILNIGNDESKRKAFVASIKALPVDEQNILSLHFNERISIGEIARMQRCSTTTIYTKLNRALFKLRNEFTPEIYKKMYSILYPETGKPTPIVSSTVSEYDPANNRSIA